MIKMFSEVNAPKIVVKNLPTIEDLIHPPLKASRVVYFPLVKDTPHAMPVWQQHIKRGMDISISLLAIILLMPVYALIAIGVKMTSRGPVLFRQQRVGMNGKPFQMIKFRTMRVDAEKHGPQLSSKADPRITCFGKFLRKVRLDETPQLFTVLFGTMSLVGPRPERQYYIDQIVERAPHYKILLKVKPGITSWGQIKYGYAENINQMVERLRFDMHYMENMSILTDLKVLIHTVVTVLQASGR